MVRIVFLTGAIILALGFACPAGALTLRCVPDGQVAAPGHHMSLEITIKPNGEFGSIILMAVDGAIYDRGEQFDEQNRQDGNGRRYWTGRSRTDPNLTTVGFLSRKGDQLIYSETISDKLLGATQITSTCKPIVELLM